jgi:hypothetical protein
MSKCLLNLKCIATIFCIIVVLVINIVFLSGCQPGGSSNRLGRTYYVDGETGDDRNVGTTARKAWKSIERVNRVDFRSGDKLLFKGNWSYAGTLLFEEEDGGALEKPVVVSSFGGGRAVIDGGETTAFRLDGSQYVVVGNMAFVGCGRKNGNDGNGVQLRRTLNVELDMLEVSGFRFSGVSTVGDENTRITRVYAHDNGFAGISTSPSDRDENGELKGRYRGKNLYIGYCVAENNPGDVKNLSGHSGNGIVVGGFDGGLIEYCRAFNNGWDMPRKGNGPVGIWGWDCDGLIIQHCISHDNKTAEGAYDGGGFDFDGGVTNSILQYNLSYNNHGTGYLLCEYPGAKRWRDNICRYNISINDGLTNHFSGIHFWAGGKDISNALVYNNLIINSRYAINTQDDIAGLVFYNNILIADVAVIEGPLKRGVFKNNLYLYRPEGSIFKNGDEVFKALAHWAEATGNETVDGKIVGLSADPKLILPGHVRGLPMDPTQLTIMPFCRLNSDSPCVGAGKVIEDNGGRDFFGNEVSADRRPSIGVHEPKTGK